MYVCDQCKISRCPHAWETGGYAPSIYGCAGAFEDVCMFSVCVCVCARAYVRACVRPCAFEGLRMYHVRVCSIYIYIYIYIYTCIYKYIYKERVRESDILHIHAVAGDLLRIACMMCLCVWSVVCVSVFRLW